MVTDFKKILEVGESFFSINEAEELLKRIMFHAKDFCQAERSTLFIKKTSGSGDNKKETLLRSFVATKIGGKIEKIEVSARDGIVGLTYHTGSVQVVNDVESHPHFNSRIDEMTQFKTQSILSVPLFESPGKVMGVLQVLNKVEGVFDDEDVRRAKLLSLFAVMALGRIEDRKKINQIKRHFGDQSRKSIASFSLSSNKPEIHALYEKLRLVSESQSSVLLLGESGTGKEVTARYIHAHSDRAHAPFVVVNCAAIPASLFEAELFGIKKGVATDVQERDGVFQKADGGTLFLDEIGELPFEMQSKLLRVLQEKMVMKVGDTEEKPIDIRLICATNRDLEQEAKKNEKFREDLYFRINVFQFLLPPLRERLEDLESLCQDIMEKICQEQKVDLKIMDLEAIDKLKTYAWPGNIRELRNVLERACVLAKGRQNIGLDDILLPAITPKDNVIELRPTQSLEKIEEMNKVTKQFQKDYALKVVEHFDGNKSKAAESLNLSREGLRKILKRDVA